MIIFFSTKEDGEGKSFFPFAPEDALYFEKNYVVHYLISFRDERLK